MSGLGIDFWEIAIHIINVVVLFVVLRLLLYKPVHRFMKRRSDSIAMQLDNAAKTAAEAQQLRIKYDEMLKSAQNLASELIENSKVSADEQARLIIEDAQQNARKIVEKSLHDIERQKNQAKIDMREEITNMAIDIAERILQREVSVKDNMDTIDKFFLEKVDR
jgi:F-type H+-transporting ATPase subunit b